MNENEVEATPSKMTKVYSSEKYEKTYETAFGKFKMNFSGGEVYQELSKPGKVTTISGDTEKTTWKITTQQYQFEVVRTHNSVIQTCTTPDGELEKVKERGEVTESFRGMNQDQVMEVCEQAEKDLQEEVEKMEQIVEKSEIPSTETKTSMGGVKIKEINVTAEWAKIENAGSSNTNITGWKLIEGRESGSGAYTYTFGNLILQASKSVNVYSGGYADNTTMGWCDTELCWTTSGKWDGSRDVAILKDSDGKEVDRCVYIDEDVVDGLVVCT